VTTGWPMAIRGPGSVARMAIYALGELEPRIDPTAYVHPDATVIGDVVIGAEASIWPQAVLRGDNSRITIGPRTSIQDGAVLHCTPELPTTVGADCVVGHLAHLEGCTVDDRSLIGTGSVVLHRAHVGRGALVGAGAVVPNDMEVPPGAMALGIPAKLRLDAAPAEDIAHGAASYVERGKLFRAELRRLDG
jgi:carbonic anhydrase/acetyltransferase-like protein (isoleucine patch superfamily)